MKGYLWIWIVALVLLTICNYFRLPHVVLK